MRRTKRRTKEIVPMKIKLHVLIQPIQTLIDTIQNTGEVDTYQDKVLMQAPDRSNAYNAVTSIYAICEIFEQWCEWRGIDSFIGDLRLFANKLDSSSSLVQEDLDNAQKVLNRILGSDMTQDEATKLVKLVLIRDGIKNRS